MKQRILVMNGQRLVQSEQNAKWQTDKVEKAGIAKPGIYNIYLAVEANKSMTHEGMVVYADKEHIYQQVGKNFVKHARTDFGKIVDVGSNAHINYENDKAVVNVTAIKHGRRLSR